MADSPDHDHEHVSKAAYEGIISSMKTDRERSKRERELERAFGDPMPTLIRDLNDQHRGNRSAMLREANKRLDEWGSETALSRGTLYKYCDDYLE